MEFRNNNLEVLNSIYQNTSMGIGSLDDVLKISDDEKFSELLKSQKTEYIKFQDAARDKIREYGNEPKDISPMLKIYSNIGIKAETFMDKSPSNIAEMIIEGNNMGIIEINKDVNNQTQVDESVLRFTRGLVTFEQKAITDLKKYL